jgi:hypothetical protein
MRRSSILLLLALVPAVARADLTVIYAPAAPAAPLVARVVEDTGAPTSIGATAPAAAIIAEPLSVILVRGGERASLRLVDPPSLVELSILARAEGSPRPSTRELVRHTTDPAWIAAGIRRLHPGLAERLRALADRFPGHRIEIVSGHEPDAAETSRHHWGLALDVRVEGASLDAVHDAVLRFPRTGVGLDRAAGFVHLDVRERSFAWIR